MVQHAVTENLKAALGCKFNLSNLTLAISSASDCDALLSDEVVEKGCGRWAWSGVGDGGDSVAGGCVRCWLARGVNKTLAAVLFWELWILLAANLVIGTRVLVLPGTFRCTLALGGTGVSGARGSTSWSRLDGLRTRVWGARTNSRNICISYIVTYEIYVEVQNWLYLIKKLTSIKIISWSFVYYLPFADAGFLRLGRGGGPEGPGSNDKNVIKYIH